MTVERTRQKKQLSLGKGPIAQRLEQGTHNPLVPGSNPGGPTERELDFSKVIF
jgi:hypothetical protein